MKIIYIAHPISGDVAGNLLAIQNIVREINLNNTDIVPLVPYAMDCLALDDNRPAERLRGIANGMAVLESGMIDELHLYGPAISTGMKAEIELAWQLSIPITAHGETIEPYRQMLPELQQKPKRIIPGAVLIAKERAEQMYKHGFTVEHDVRYNQHGELTDGAHFALTLAGWPPDWDKDFANRISRKSYRVKTAGAFSAAELERLQYVQAHTLVVEDTMKTTDKLSA